MKKIWFAFLVVLILVGCSNKESVEPQTNKENEIQLDTPITQDEELKRQLEERPNLPALQLRETLNLSLKIIRAMDNLDFNFLETVVAPNTKIDHEKKVFIFENGHEQNFLNVDYNILEYHFHDLTDGVITVAFAQPSSQHGNIEIYFEFVQENGKYLLNSYTTN